VNWATQTDEIAHYGGVMSKFKVGDRVVRIESFHMGMGVGDIGTVKRVYDDSVLLEEYGTGGHSQKNLKLNNQWKGHKR